MDMMKGEDVGKGNGQMVGGRYHCIMVRSFDFIVKYYYYCCCCMERYSIYIGTASPLRSSFWLSMCPYYTGFYKVTMNVVHVIPVYATGSLVKPRK